MKLKLLIILIFILVCGTAFADECTTTETVIKDPRWYSRISGRIVERDCIRHVGKISYRCLTTSTFIASGKSVSTDTTQVCFEIPKKG